MVRVVHLHVGNDQELVQQLAGVRIQQREVFLVLLHGEDQAFLRHIEEFLLELADIHLRPFDQSGHFVQQGAQHTAILVGHGQQFFHVEIGVPHPDRRILLGQIVQARHDALTALREAGDHTAVAGQDLFVIVCVIDGDALAAHEAVAAGNVAAGQAQYIGQHHALAVQDDQPVHRTHELMLGIAPAHQLRHRQLFQCLRHDVLQILIQRLALLFDARRKVLRLAVAHALQLGQCDVGRAHETFQRLGRLAFGIQARSHRRSLCAR